MIGKFNHHSTKVTLAVAGKFHALSLAKEYAKKNKLRDIYCINRNVSTPPNIPKKNYHNRLDLAWFQIIGSRVPGKLYSHRLKEHMFDKWIANKLVRQKPGVLHGWNGCSYETFKVLKKTEWKKCVERSCPYNQFQYDLLSEEAENLGVSYYKDQEKLKYEIEELYLADTIICPSLYSANTYKDPELRKKLVYVPLGSNNKYKERAMKKTDPLRILLVGNNFLRKGTHYLIEAMKQIEDPLAELWIRGDVPKSYINEIKDPRIKVIGVVSETELTRLYSSANVFVQPSIDEGFGMTVLEALSYGLPLIVTENVGAKDILNEKVAKVIPIRDSNALAQAILKARDLTGQNFDEARKLIIDTFSWAKCADEIAAKAYKL